MENESKVNLIKNHKGTEQSVKPAVKGQAIPEGVTEVNGFPVQREDILYIAPKPLFSGKGRRTW